MLSYLALFLSMLLFDSVIGLPHHEINNATLQDRANSNNLWELNDAFATYYYDLSGRDICAPKQQSPGWSAATIDDGIPRCGQLPLNDPKLNTNRIVALNWTVMNTDLGGFCGKEVEIYQDGKKFDFSEGKLVLWDTCERCMCENVVDVSALVYAELAGTRDCSGHPKDLKIVITLNQIWEPQLESDATWKKDPPNPQQIPLKGGNSAPVFPGRVAGHVCDGVKHGMPVSTAAAAADVATVANSPTQTGGTGTVAPKTGTPAPAPAPAQANSAGLGTCAKHGRYACVGNYPAVCDVFGNWVAVSAACSKCALDANNAPSCV